MSLRSRIQAFSSLNRILLIMLVLSLVSSLAAVQSTKSPQIRLLRSVVAATKTPFQGASL
jgi:hypothetical protein